MSKPSYTVTVFPSSLSPHLSQIYSGLMELAALRQIRLCWARPTRTSVESTLWLHVERTSDGESRALFFDLFDQASFADIQALDKCTSYFKRSYARSSINHLPNEFQARIRPYGLNFPCSTERLFTSMQFRKYVMALRESDVLGNTIASRRIARAMLNELVLPKLPRWCQSFYFAQQSQFAPSVYTCSPNDESQSRVLYRTRLFDVSEDWTEPVREHAVTINRERIKLVRLLRSRLGNTFVGGIYGSRKTLATCPRECICPHRMNKRTYLALVKRCAVTVVSRGLRNSIGWRLAECCAAGRAIVAEPLAFSLPSPLVEGEHLVTYDSADECVDKCELLLEQPELVRTMRRASYQYFQSEVRPVALVANRLDDAFANDSETTQPD